MLTIKIQVDAPEWQAQAVKESLAMYLERFGDAKVVKITETSPEQMRIKGEKG